MYRPTYMLRFFHLAKKASAFISVGSMNLFMEMGIFSGILWGFPLQVKTTLRSGCAVKSPRHSTLTICWNWAPASTVDSTVFTWSCIDDDRSGDNVAIGWKFCKEYKWNYKRNLIRTSNKSKVHNVYVWTISTVVLKTFFTDTCHCFSHLKLVWQQQQQ